MYSCRIVVRSKCGLVSASVETNDSLVLFQVFPVNTDDNYIFATTRNADIDELRPILLTDFNGVQITKSKNFTTIQGVKKSHGMMGSIIKNGGIPLYPIVVDRGTETFDFIVTSKSTIENVLESAGKHNHVEQFYYDKITGSDFIGLMSKKNGVANMMWLTDIEKNIIKKAFKNGFFKWPREYNLDLMVSEFKLSKPTILYHIRNSERKILKSLLE